MLINNDRVTVAKAKAKEIAKYIATDNGGEGYVDTAIKVIISAVIGAAVLTLLYALVVTFVMPNVTTKVENLFNDPTASKAP